MLCCAALLFVVLCFVLFVCLLACLLARLLVCLFVCLLACFLAFLLSCFLSCFLAFLLSCFLACLLACFLACLLAWLVGWLVGWLVDVFIYLLVVGCCCLYYLSLPRPLQFLVSGASWKLGSHNPLNGLALEVEVDVFFPPEKKGHELAGTLNMNGFVVVCRWFSQFLKEKCSGSRS